MTMKIEEIEVVQKELVGQLVSLTKKGKASWFRQNVDSSFVFCAVDGDLISFELADGTEENLMPFENTHAILAKIRNYSLLWLEGQNKWDEILALVKAAEIDNDDLVKARESALLAAVAHFRLSQ